MYHTRIAYIGIQRTCKTVREETQFSMQPYPPALPSCSMFSVQDRTALSRCLITTGTRGDLGETNSTLMSGDLRYLTIKI